MRSLAVLLAFVGAFLTAAPCEAQFLPGTPSYAAVFGHSGGVLQFVATAPTPIASTFLGYDNISNVTTKNNGISLASGATIPPAAPSNWWAAIKFKVDDQLGGTAVQANPITLAAVCGTQSCGSSNDRKLQISNPGVSSTAARQREVLFSASRNSGTAGLLWTPPAGLTGTQTGINLVAGVNYCIVVQQLSNGIMWISANDSTGAPASGSPSISTTVNNTPSPVATNYYYNAGSSSPAAQTNLFNTLGTELTATNAYANGTAGPLGDFAFGAGAIPNTANTPTPAVLSSLCDGSKTLNQWVTDNGLTIVSHYPLNNPNASPPTSFAADPAGSFTTAATVIAGDSSKIIPASPLTPAPCLTLNEKGPYDVAPLDAGQVLVGQIRVSGKINAASCGGTPSGVEAQAVNIGTGVAETPWTTLTLAGNAYRGYLTNVPASTTALSSFHRISVRIKNSPSYVLAGQYPIGVGFSYLRVGQSQVAIMCAVGASGTGSQIAGNGSATALSMTLNDSGNILSNKGQGQPSMVQLDAINNPGGGSTSQILGDGCTEEIQDLSANLGNVPVKVVNIAKSGQASDAWAEDYQRQVATLTGSGTGAYASTSVFASASPTGAGGALAYVGSLVSVNLPAGPQMSVLKGSVTLVDANGATVATESGGGTFAGAGVNAGGTLNYLTGAVSGVTFTSAQASPLTAHWTEISDTAAGSYTQQSPYVGFPVFGDGVNSASGYATQVLNQVYQPFSAILFEQCSSDSGNLAATIPPSNNNSGYNLAWQTKWRYVLETKLAAFGWFRANTPTMVLGFGRDVSTLNNVSGCRQALLNFASIGGQYRFGGNYYDELTQCSGVVLCLSPHPGPWVLGGRRFGRRGAAFLCALQAASTTSCPNGGSPFSITEPQITSAVRSGTTITFTVNNSGALTNCGTNLSGGSDTPSATVNTCSPPGTPVGTAVFGMAFGLATNAMFNSLGLNWQSSPTSAGIVDDTKVHTCQIASATTFTCTAPWFTSGMYWTWMQGGPAQEAGTIKALSVTGGSGYTGSGATVTGSGATNAAPGTCTHATASIHQSGGVVTASRVTVGVNCVGTDTFALTGLSAGSGGAVSGVYYASHEDYDHVGQVLYDNQGGCGGTVSAVVYEPGCLVAPVVIPQGPLAFLPPLIFAALPGRRRRRKTANDNREGAYRVAA